VGIQLRQGIDKVYVPYKLSGKVIDCKPKWFYIKNHGKTLLVITQGPPIIRPEWKEALGYQPNSRFAQVNCKSEGKIR